jgi:hypothetical protein
MTATHNRTHRRYEIQIDEFAKLELAFRSGDRASLREALVHADSKAVQETLSYSERAELADLIGEAYKRLFMEGYA